MHIKYHKRLGYVSIVLALLSLGNATDYFFGTQNDFKIVRGRVAEVNIESFHGRTRYTRNTYYTKTEITINDSKKRYYTTEKTNEDSLLLQLKIGDEIDIYTKRWYHYFSYFGLNANVFLVKKGGVVVYDVIYRCKRANKLFMIVYLITALFFYVIYLDVVKGISLENWFQKRVLKNKDYLNK